MAQRRVVVVGGDAAGMSAASVIRKRQPGTSVVVLERQQVVSFSACGIPYWVSGEVDGLDDLVARTPEEHRANGVDLRLGAECTGIDLAAGTVAVRGPEGDSTVGFDELVIGTGAVPVRPDVPGIECALGVQTAEDGRRILDRLATLTPMEGRRAVVVGGGYIGVEMAEALLRRGMSVVVVDRAPEPMGLLDPEMGARVRQAMERLGIEVRTAHELRAVETSGEGDARRVVTDQGSFDADLVVLGLGVRPRTDLAAAAGLPLGEHGGLRTDDHQRVLEHPGVWAAGDCTEVLDRITGTFLHVPLGTHAAKQGRAVGTNLTGGDLAFEGVVRTALTRVCGLDIARAGLTEHQARAAGFPVEVVTTTGTTAAGYHPDAHEIVVKAVADATDGRLLGMQLVGGVGSGKRIDTVATALWNGMTVRQLAAVDLSYAPPFSPVWDPVQIVARQLSERLAG